MSYKRRPRRVKTSANSYRNYNSSGNYTSTTIHSGSRKNGGIKRTFNSKTGVVTETWGSGMNTYTSRSGGYKKCKASSTSSSYRYKQSRGAKSPRIPKAKDSLDVIRLSLGVIVLIALINLFGCSDNDEIVVNEEISMAAGSLY